MNPSNMPKLLEYLTSYKPSLNINLSVSFRQFGFRDNTNCQTVYLHSYTRENSNVHWAHIDLTKAFDQMNFDVLITKLKRTQVHLLITRLLGFMFNNYFVNVHFNGATDDEWNNGNGTRNGGFFTQYSLFSISMMS